MALILLADDVAVSRDALARALRERGHRVSVAVDGQEAVERFLRERPEAVILDMMMPRLSGLEAAARIKAAGGTFTPVLLVSARADVDTRLSALAVAEDFVAKPYDARELSARLDAHLRTRRLVEEAEARAQAGDTGGVPVPIGEARTGRTGRANKSGPQVERVLDRASFADRLDEEWKRSARTNEPLAVLVAGIDPPHRGEGAVLLLLASLQKALRSIDVVARVDDDHLAGLMLNTHITGAMTVASRLRGEMKRQLLDGTRPAVSMGLAFHPNREVAEPDDLLRLAERAIARAREEGPGRICLWQHQGYLFEPAD